ncbi:membrane protein [Candidatus Acidianus copahuensis]|uniref:Membrane protein n=1 Tax=Candidatus Acidianus copahuensis TaxID=1160895 RepID=A0A031LN77_9CREN|nr:membrane protein [Candidatus Acidianus copahuensis]EZQ04860.1 membrane protein [Candidatus Acidianus copahuensis]
MLEKVLEAFKYSLKYEKSILRRYLILGSFDGILLTMGIVVSALATNLSVRDTNLATISGITAVAISSAWNSLVVEAKEKIEEYNELQRQMMRSLKGTIYDYGTKATIFLSTITHGSSPFLGIILLLSYDYSRNLGIIIGISMIVLFLLGLSYEGSFKEKVLSGLLILIAGVITAVITVILNT